MKHPKGGRFMPSRRQALQVLAAGFGGFGAATLVGCRPSRPETMDFSESPRSFLAEDYRDVFDRWTRHARLVSANEGAIIELWATLKSWEFREAYVEKYAEAYGLSREDKASLRASELDKARAYYDFHLTVQTTDFRWNDLQKRDSTWRISLSDGTGDETFPSDVDRLKLPVPYERVFFPEKTAFSRSYHLRFDKPETPRAGFAGPVSGELALRVSGPMGGVEVSWLAT